MSSDHITNDITAVRSMCTVYGCNTAPSFSPRIPVFMDDTLFLQVITDSAQLQCPLANKALYFLAFFSFLRLSHVLPHSDNTFDKTRHLCVGDAFFC